MINLLPPELKSDYHYARRNSWLLHVITLFGIGLVGLVAIAAAGLLYLHQSASTAEQQAADAKQALVEQKQSEVEAKAQSISNSLKLAVQVLSQEVLFSQLLKQLAVVVPSNASLADITISNLQGAVDISARTTDYSSATQLQINISDPANKIFSKADIVSISCGSDTGGSAVATKYPCTVTIRAQFATDNPFLFINDKADS